MIDQYCIIISSVTQMVSCDDANIDAVNTGYMHQAIIIAMISTFKLAYSKSQSDLVITALLFIDELP